MSDNLGSESAAQSLLCTEPNLCFNYVDDQAHQSDCNNLVGNGSEPLNSFIPVQGDEILCLMFQKESEFLPTSDFLEKLRSGDIDLSVRKEAIDWICKAHAHYRFGALTVCLAVNYVDRFLSLYELPSGRNWTVQLLAVACLSLAAKLEEVNVPHIVDLQVADPKFVFEAKTIKRMELLVLSTLNWKMQACNPCTFIDYFLRKINDAATTPSRSLIDRSIQLIINTIRGIDFLEFKSSEISAAVAICVSRDTQTVDIYKAVSKFLHVEEVRVLKCVEMIQNLTLIEDTRNAANGTSSIAPPVPQSPVGVWEVACMSYKSDEMNVMSCPNSWQTSSNTKRRKLD